MYTWLRRFHLVLSQILADGGFMDLARHSYPARAANYLNADVPDVIDCCLRIMWATSMPFVEGAPNPSLWVGGRMRSCRET